MKTKFIRVYTDNRLPDISGRYLCRAYSYSNYEYYTFGDGKFKTSFEIEEYLLEVPDREDEMREVIQNYISEFEEFNFSAENYKRAKQLLNK